MALIRWNPFGEANRFDRFFNGYNWNDIEECGCAWSPSVDIYDDEKQITLTAELPGLSQEDVTVNLENNVLTISGKRDLFNEEKRDKYTRIERSYGEFTRSFRVPNTVDQTNIVATMDKGVLHLTLPKTDAAQPKQIEVKVQ